MPLPKVTQEILSISEGLGIVYNRPTIPASEYHNNLWDPANKEVLDYLINERRLTEETIRHFRIGTDNTGWITIPIYKDDELIDYKFRNVKEKMFHRIEKSETWVINESGFATSARDKYIIIVEGEFDAMAVWQMGLNSVVSGTGGAQERGMEWIRRIPTEVERVFINYDNDEPGRKAARELAERIGIEKCYNVLLPQKDANDFIREGGTIDKYKEILRNAPKFNVEGVVRISEVLDNIKNTKIERVKVNLERFNLSTKNGIPKKSLVVLSGKTGIGKCFKKGTKILMYNGLLKSVEDIRIGDRLMGNDSTPRNILSTTSGRGELFNVIPTRGSPYTVNKEHILSLKTTGDTKNGKHVNKGKIVNISVKDYINKSDKFKHTHKGWRVGVDFSQPLNSHLFLNIEPYFLGLWLGDGNSSGPGITTEDPEIKKYLNEYARRLGLITNEIKKNGTHAIRIDITNGTNPADKKEPLVTKLRNLGVLNNKHIPHVYKTANRDVRMAVLAGLIDSDGHAINGCYDYISKYEVLADDVIYLARSLGLAAYKTKKTCTIKSRQFSGEYYRVSISGDLSMVPVKIKRKKLKPRTQKKDILVTGIEVEPAGIGDYYGFEIDGNHLFLLGDFTVTHNSTCLMNFLVHHTSEAGGRRPCLLISLENDIAFTLKRILEIKYDRPITQFTEETWAKVREEMPKCPLYIDVSGKTTTFEAVDKMVEQAKKLYGIEIVGFDHIHYLLDGKYNVTQEVAAMTKNFKLMTIDRDVIIYLISHIRKMREDKAAITGEDLKDSSALQQLADMVLLVLGGRDGAGLSIDKARMSRSHLYIPILHNGDTGTMKDDFSRNVTSFGESVKTDDTEGLEFKPAPEIGETPVDEGFID